MLVRIAAPANGMIDQVRDTWAERRQAFGGETVRIDIALTLIEFLLVLPETSCIVTFERETRTSA